MGTHDGRASTAESLQELPTDPGPGATGSGGPEGQGALPTPDLIPTPITIQDVYVILTQRAQSDKELRLHLEAAQIQAAYQVEQRQRIALERKLLDEDAEGSGELSGPVE